MLDLTLRQLQCVLGVARGESMADLGEGLGLSPSQVSRNVARVEQALGCAIFERSGESGHRLSHTLTREGRDLVAAIARSAAESEGLAAFSSALRRSKAGKILVGYTPFTALTSLSWFLAKVKEGFPGVEVGMVPTDDQTIETRLVAGSLDLAVGSPPYSDPSLRLLPLHLDRLCLAVPSALGIEGECPLDHPAITEILVAPTAQWPNTSRLFRQRCDALGLRPRLVPSVDDALARLAMVQGLGKIALVSGVRDRMQFPGVRVLPIRDFDEVGFETALVIGPNPAPLVAQVYRQLGGA